MFHTFGRIRGEPLRLEFFARQRTSEYNKEKILQRFRHDSRFTSFFVLWLKRQITSKDDNLGTIGPKMARFDSSNRYTIVSYDDLILGTIEHARPQWMVAIIF